MKKYLIIALLLLSATAYGFGGLMMGSGTTAVSGACSTSISDDFSGTLTLWSELGASGGWTINSGQVDGTDNGVLLYTDEQTCTITQWAMVKVDLTQGNIYAGFYLRSENDQTTYAYAVRYEKFGTDFWWRYCGGAAQSDTAASCANIGTWANHALDDGDYFGAEVTGTGDATVVKIYDLGTTAKSHANWASSNDGTTTLTDNPAYAADTGKYVGLYSGSVNDYGFDDFEAGSD